MRFSPSAGQSGAIWAAAANQDGFDGSSSGADADTSSD
jgi:hypothetical protein